MIERRALCPDRIRKIEGGFAFLEHRFLRDGFFESLTHHELMLYLFLVLAGDRKGLSFYSYDKMCSLLCFSIDEYLLARDDLIQKDLIAFDGHMFQVLSLPQRPVREASKPLRTEEDMSRQDPATVRQIILHSLGESHG
ncbi:MAG: hypothetical protein ABII26_06425 [Pseudomonadota bacterium]